MSGRKDVYVRVPRDEINRLRNNAKWSEETAHEAKQREKRAQAALDAANMKLETLNRALNSEIAGLQGDMRNMANEQNRRFREQAAECNRKLENQRIELQSSLNDVSQRIERYKTELTSSINDVRQQSEKNRKELQNQINGINARIRSKEQNEQKLAEFWVSQTQAYIKDIEQYRHEMFTPGQLERLNGKFEQMLSSMKNEMYQAVIATAMGLFNEAVDLKEEVLNAETEWLYYHGLFLQALAATEANLDRCNNLQFTFDTENGKETVDAKVNYWTEGVLDEVSALISGVKQNTAQIQQVSTQQLIDHITNLNRQNVIMETASTEAKEVMILSQCRADMANKIADVLEAVMWNCERVTYVGGEENQPVHVKLSDGMGNEMVVIVSPEINAQGMSNKVELNFFDSKNDERQRKEWIESIRNGLRKAGFEVGEAVCVGDTENKPSPKTELLDIEATARQQIKKPEKARR